MTSTTYYSLRIELTHSEPMIWRRLLVPANITLPKLHRAIQGAMGWSNSHLHQFHIGNERYSEPDPYDNGRLIDEKGVKLSSLLVEQVREFIYEYDFGDDWQHRLVLEQVQQAHPSWKGSLCTAGQRACPPENVGGIWGYAEFLSAIANPQHEQHIDMLCWIGGVFDPEGFDINSANVRIRKLKG